ncbi:unnamed protein product [Rotaria sp. Silwood1]|nr:unnamed protein product [Rotaria sp. Silwood1]
MESIQASLDKIHYPSNTTGIPRPLIFLKKYKSSELRTLLLFGIFAFREGLNELHYKRGRKLPSRETIILECSQILIFLGDKVSSGKTTIRVFPTAPTITYSLRTNEWYDQTIEIVCNPNVQERTTEDEILEMLCGHKGFCRLRDLSNFDIGQSFTNDSLHNVYHGVFRRILMLLFDDKYAKQKWSCKNKMKSIQASLDKIHYPSNTTRIPRPLMFFKKYKGSELRTLLLFGIFAFREGLNGLHYKREYFTTDA